ncbi:TonB-dependent receptor [bacterium]|nr:TonB-dependent receptor [bacterium]
MKPSLYIVIPLLWAAAAGSVPAQQTVTGRITGIVTDRETGKPLAGCNVVVESTVLGGAADSGGRFTISRLRPGTYAVTAMMIGYRNETKRDVRVTGGGSTEIAFALKPTTLEMPTMVVTASKRQQSIEDTPVSVDVVNREAIESRNVTTLDEVLTNTAGVGIIDGQLDIRGSTGFNWSAGSRVLFMVDGHPMISGETGGISWDAIPVEQIEAVEVVKGAGSALYGSNAMAGMVNVITRDPSDTPVTRFRVSLGYFDEPAYPEWRWTDRFLTTQIADGAVNLGTALSAQSIDLSHSRKAGPVGLLVNVGRKVSDGYHQNGDYSRWNVLAKARIKPASNQTLVISTVYASDDHGDFLQWKSQENALEVPDAELGNRVTNEKTNINATFKHGVSALFAYTLKANFYRVGWHNHFYDNDDYAVTDRAGFEVQTDYIRGAHSITAGSEVIYHQVESPMYGNQRTGDAALYAEDVISVGGTVTVTAGSRFDYHHVEGIGSDRQISPRVGLSARPWRGGSLRLSAGYGFRAPSIAEVFANLTVSGFRVVPNLELREAERAWNFETGLHQGFSFGSGGWLGTVLNPEGMVDLAFFYSRYTNMIDVDLNTDLMAFQFINLNKARNMGAELRVAAALFRGMLSINSGLTCMDPVNLETDKMLNYRSRYRFTGGFSLKLGRVTLAYDYRYASRTEEVVDIFRSDQRVPMHVMDARILYRLGAFQIGFETKNLRNYHYSLRQRSIEPVRQFVLSLRGEI